METRQELFDRFARALNERDMTALENMVDPELIVDIPQSGERTQGVAAFRAQLESYPGATPETQLLDRARLVGDEERWAITPSYTVVPLAAGRDFTVMMRSTYPDGSTWHIVSLISLRDDRVYRMENYFAPELPAPLAEHVGTGQPG
jgi:hypothetical protein